MPTIPWKSYPTEAPDECHCLTSVLPLKHYRDVPRFLLWTLRIRRQLKTTGGVAGYGLRAELLRTRFWTLFAWESSDSMMEFVRSGSHGEMLADMKGRLGKSTFQEWEAPRSSLPLRWADARVRLRSAGAAA